MLIPPGYEPHLAAVTAAPFDDLPRLAMADWLDEHGGGEWAAYIREQVAEYDWSRPEWYQAEMVRLPLRRRASTPGQRIADAFFGPGIIFTGRGFPCGFGTPHGCPHWLDTFPITFGHFGRDGTTLIAIRPNGEVWAMVGGLTVPAWVTESRNLGRFMRPKAGKMYQRLPGLKNSQLDALRANGEPMLRMIIDRTAASSPPPRPRR